jgi:hypothetical protein
MLVLAGLVAFSQPAVTSQSVATASQNQAVSHGAVSSDRPRLLPCWVL